MDALKLVALDDQDLGVISAHVQDAVMKVGDLEYLPARRRFVLPMNRFAWERKSGFLRQRNERRRSVLHFDRVLGVKTSGIARDKPDDVLSLLAVSFVPLIAWGLRGHAELWQLLLAASVYWSAGMAGVPAWNSWMASLVPDRMRTTYFAQRSRLSQFGVFAGFVVGGLVLQFAEPHGLTLPAFALLFALAATFRLLSTACLWACREPRRPPGIEAGAPRQPLAARVAFAQQARAASQAHQSEMKQGDRATFETVTDVAPAEVEATFTRYGVDRIIHGHTHRPAIHPLQVGEAPCTRVVLGDWYEQGSVLRVDPDGMVLESLAQA